MAKYLVFTDEETGEEVGRTDVTDMRDTSFDETVYQIISNALDGAFHKIDTSPMRPVSDDSIAQAIYHTWGFDLADVWREWVQEG